MVPPACSILARAEAETDTPFTTSLRCSSPMPSSFTGWPGRRISPAPNSVAGLTSTPSLRIDRRRRDELALFVEGGAERGVARVDHDGLMVLRSRRLERALQARGVAAARACLADLQLPVAHRRQELVAAGFALAVLPYRRITCHGPLPGAACSGSPLPRRRAPSRRAVAW